MSEKNFYPFDGAVLIDGDEAVYRVEFRGTHHIHLCGYTAIPAASIPAEWAGNYDADALQYLDVHGGITYAEVEGNGAWCVFGFDCAHAGDEHQPELMDPAHVMKLAKRMRRQLQDFASRIGEWRAADRDQRIKIIEEIRGPESGPLGFGALLGCMSGGREFGE